MAIIDIFKGDDVQFVCKVNTDLTDCELRAELWDDFSNYVRKATGNVPGGSQIVITNAVEGRFTIYIERGDTTDFNRETKMQIKLTTSDYKEHTISEHALTLQDKKIDWTNLSSIIIATLPAKVTVTIPAIQGVVEGTGVTITPTPATMTFTVPAPTIITT